MAIALVESFSEDTGGSVTADYTTTGTVAPTGDDLMILAVQVNIRSSSNDPETCVYDPSGSATELTLVGLYEESGTGYDLAIYRLMDSDIAKGVAKNFQFTSVGSARQGFIVAVFSGVDQTTPLGTPVTEDESVGDSVVSNSISSASGDLVVDAVLSTGRSFTGLGAGQTEVETESVASTAAHVRMSTEPGDTSVTMSHTLDNTTAFYHWLANLNAAAGGGAVQETIEESLELTDTTTTIRRSSFTVPDNTTFSDTVTAVLRHKVQISDSLTLNETVSGFTGQARAEDTFTITDETLVTLRASLESQDTTVFTDDVTASTRMSVSVEETLLFTDEATGVTQGGSFSENTMGFSDTVLVRGTYHPSSQETLGLQDEVTALRKVITQVDESLTFTDTVAVNQQLRNTVADFFQLTDAVTASLLSTVFCNETLSFSDEVASRGRFSVTISETLTFSETTTGITVYAGLIKIKDVTGNLSRAVTIGKVSIAIGYIK